MPRGENKETNLAAKSRSSRRNSHPPKQEEVAVLEPLAWDEAAGPEATREELEEVLLNWEGEVIEVAVDNAMRAVEEPDYWPDSTQYISRRGLETMLAAMHGQDLEEYKRENADRPWLSLYKELEELDDSRWVKEMAQKAEERYRHALRWDHELKWGAPPSFYDEDRVRDASELFKLRDEYYDVEGGKATGNMEDYTRKELCQLLGYLQRDAKDLSDDELRAMALDTEAIANFDGRPSHRDLALLAAYRERTDTWGSTQRHVRAFRKALKTPYAVLWRSVHDAGPEAAGYIPRNELVDQLSEKYPFLFVNSEKENYRQSELAKLADKAGIQTKLSESQRRKPPADKKYVSSLDNRFGDVFTGMVEEMGGGHLDKVVGHGAGAGTWTDTARRSRSAWGIYFPKSGEVHINPKLDRLVGKAQQGKAEDMEIYHATSTIAHELIHATSGGGQVRDAVQSGTKNHTIEEGCTEALARLKTEKLAEKMGLWNSKEKGSLRKVALDRNAGTYRNQVETMVALCAAAMNEASLEDIKSGKFRQPEALSERGQAFLEELHTSTGDWGSRTRRLISYISENTDADHDDVERAIDLALRHAQGRQYQWSWRWGDEGKREYSQPASLSEKLASLFDGILPSK